MGESGTGSTTAAALLAAGDREAARDIGALDRATEAADRKLAATERGLVERLIYGPAPSIAELQAGGVACAELERQQHPAFEAALSVLASGTAYTADGKLSAELREAMAAAGAYGLTVPTEYGGRGESYLQLAKLEESLAASGLGPAAVEISGELTIGAGALLGYGSDEQRRTFLPMVSEGTLLGFALTEVGTGVNAKKIGAYVETDDSGNYRLFASGSHNKLWITNSCHGGLVAIVARIGKDGPDLGLFVTQLPDRDVEAAEGGWEFRCTPSGVDAFTANHNSRLHFHNYPIAAANRIPGNGVEVLFYCLRLGRCMLAAMSAGYQRMLARDASHYARERPGVGGLVIRHELPQLAIGRMLGGSLQSRALAFMALSQDAARIDLAGLRDLTKSAAAQTGIESMLAAEHVLGGRSFARSSRVNAARSNLHLFGVVEGEDDMIRMGMVRDVTARFVDRYLAPILGQLRAANTGPDGDTLPAADRILRLSMGTLVRHPARTIGVIGKLVANPAPYRILGWIGRNFASDLLHAPLHLLPSNLLPRYRPLPSTLREHARRAERELRALRWRHLWLSLDFQLELTGAQIALQRLGQQIEWLTSVVVLCHHAAVQDETQWRIADLQCLLLLERVRGAGAGLGTRRMRRLRKAVADVGADVASDTTSLFRGLPAEAYQHPFK
jgi:alkylation response protein AidB-like acyl-CoA dehydrogenase